MPAGASPFVDDLLPTGVAPAPAAPAPAVDDGWASLGLGAAAGPAPAPAPAPAPEPVAPPTAMDYLTRLKAEQDAALLMQSNPRDQAYFEAQAMQAAAQPPAVAAATPPVVRRQCVPTCRLPPAAFVIDQHTAACRGLEMRSCCCAMLTLCDICLRVTRLICLSCAQAAALPPPAAAVSVVDPAKVEMLTGLGFSAEQARLALESSNGDADQAANMLFSAG